MPIRSALPAGQFIVPTGTVRPASAKGTKLVSHEILSHTIRKTCVLFTFPSWKLMLGRIFFLSSSSMAFMTLVTPEAPSECPMLGLT